MANRFMPIRAKTGKKIKMSWSSQSLKRMIAAAFVFGVVGLIAAQGNWLTASFAAFSPVSGSSSGSSGDQEEQYSKVKRDDCGYLQDPEGVKGAMSRHREEVALATNYLARNTNFSVSELTTVPPNDIPRNNFIDNILFDKMAADSIASAPMCTDAEFVRRAYLDLAGQIPTADVVTAFLNDQAANKRAALVDRLIGSPEYVDKWTMFFNDLYKNTARSTNVVRYEAGRTAFYEYIKKAISENRPYNQLARELITSNGDNFVVGEANWIIGGTVPMGPTQDTMDGTAVNAASMFLGISAVDCLLCHDGAGHLDQVNLWGSQATRMGGWNMAAFFARTRRVGTVLSQNPLYIKRTVSEAPNGEYALNTTSGNRPEREPQAGKNNAEPIYLFGAGKPNAGENRREAFARLMTADKQFARAAVNYIWEKIMVEALVSPSNAFDPARLSASAKLPDGWTPQPANPALLEALADDFIRNGYDLRKLMAAITKSSAYQLSAQYPGSWNLSMIPYYARKYVRRLDAEEVHDSIMKATNIGATYTIVRNRLDNTSYTVTSAMQLPDTIGPNNAIGGFLNAFIRGDRDVKPRSNEPSILQALNLMNNQFVMTRIHQTNAGSNVARLLANAALTPEQIITQLYLATLSRNPSADELNTLTPLFSSQTRRDATEAIQWALLNKIDFVFNY